MAAFPKSEPGGTSDGGAALSDRRPAVAAIPADRAGLLPGGLLRGTVREAAWIVGHLALYPTGLVSLGLRAVLPSPRVNNEDDRDHEDDGHHGDDKYAEHINAPDHPLRAADRLAVSATCDTPNGTGPLPVVLVHGLADNRSIFAVLRRALRRQGMTSLHPFDHNPLGGDIRTKAELLDRHIAQVVARTGAPGVHVVGHSLGGLIARYHAQFLDRGVRVHTVLTLGTPHGGTAAAYLLRAHPLVREMCPDSPLVAELAAPAPGVTTRFIAYWGDLDPFVVPCASGALRHPDLDATSVLVRGAGHLTLPACRIVVSDVCTLLTAPPTAIPDAPAPTRSAVPAPTTSAASTGRTPAPRSKLAA